MTKRTGLNTLVTPASLLCPCGPDLSAPWKERALSFCALIARAPRWRSDREGNRRSRRARSECTWINQGRSELVTRRFNQGQTMHPSWFRFSVEATMLAFEAQRVIWTRISQMALGQGSPAENFLMVTEKMAAFGEAATTIAMGGTAHKVVKGYRRRVRANIRRLGR